MLSDLRHALRQLIKTPGFTFTIVVTLALGIGATTAIFTLVQQVMLKSLPVVKPEQLYRIGDKIHCCNWGGYTQEGEFSLFSWELYKHFRDNTAGFEQLAALQGGNAPLGVRRMGTAQQAETRNGQYVSGNFFETFGVGPWIGRVLTPEDDREGAPPVTVMSYHVWKEKYGGDPSVVGTTYQLNGHPYTVVGVGAPGFYGAKLAGYAMPDFWLPLTAEILLDGATERLKSPDQHFLDLIGRVKPGTNPKTLEAQLRGELHDWQASHVADMSPQEKEIWQKQTLHLTPGGAGLNNMREDYADGLRLLLAAAGCVLLVACANIANLLLARGLKNRQQTAVRIALGSSRGHLVRKALVESVMLGVVGGLLGIGVAFAATKLILHLAFAASSAQSYVPVHATPSWPVLLFTLGISVLTGIIFGIAPAWMTSHAEPVEALRGARSSTGEKGRWPQKTLVIAQAAVSLVLLTAAALLGQSLRNLKHQNFGFQTQGRYLANINPLLGGYKAEELEPLFKKIQERLGAIPGVRGVSGALYAPMSGDSWNTSVRVAGRPEPPAKQDTGAGWTRVTPGFFDTVGDRMVSGRPITEEDTATTRSVAVINEAFAKKFFPGENPIGKHFGPGQTKYSGLFEVIGVAGDVRYITYDLREPVQPMFFLAESQSTHYSGASENAGELWSHYLYNLVLWAPGNPPGIEAQVRKALGEIDPNLVLYSVESYDHVLGADFAQQNMIATLTLLFGGLGLVLAAVGLYGVTAYTVEQRTSEIGVRMALGANRGNVVSMILRDAFWQVGVGLAVGIPAAIGAGWAITTQLFGVKFWDPAMLSVAVVLLAIAALTAALVPAQRAAGLDPMRALRTE
jgi:putative ABC transport system permease protein